MDVVGPARRRELRLDFVQRPLEHDHRVRRFEVRVPFGDDEYSREQSAHLRVKCDAGGGVHAGRRRLRPQPRRILEQATLVLHIAARGLDDARHEIAAELQLDVDGRERVVGGVAARHEPVVQTNEDESDQKANRDRDKPTDAHGPSASAASRLRPDSLRGPGTPKLAVILIPDGG